MTLFKILLRLLLSMTDLETMAVLSVAPGTSAYMLLTFKKASLSKLTVSLQCPFNKAAIFPTN